MIWKKKSKKSSDCADEATDVAHPQCNDATEEADVNPAEPNNQLNEKENERTDEEGERNAPQTNEDVSNANVGDQSADEAETREEAVEPQSRDDRKEQTGVERLLNAWKDREEGMTVDEFLEGVTADAGDGPFAENLTKSLQGLLHAEDDGGEAADYSEALTEILNIAADLADGIIARDVLGLVNRGLCFDAAVEAARTEGELAGRNAAIIEQMDRDDEEAVDDGLPHLTSGLSRGSLSPASLFDIARGAY